MQSLTMVTDSVLAAGCRDNSIRLWDVDTGECLRTLESVHSDWVRCLLLHRSWLVSGSVDRLIKVWRMPSGDAVATLRGHTAAIVTMSNVDATHTASGSRDHTVRLWNMVTLTCERTIDNACGGEAVCCVVSLGPWLICCADRDPLFHIQYLRVFDVSSGECVQTLEQPKPHICNGVCSILCVDDIMVVGGRGPNWEPKAHPSIRMWH